MSNVKGMKMRVYVGTYHKYACGSIAGAWLDIEDYSDKEEFYEACKELHKDESDPELMFQDWEDIPKGMISESSIEDEVFEIAQMSEDDRELLAVYREDVNQEGTIEEAKEEFFGEYDSAEDFAEEFHEENGDLAKVPKALRYCIDWEDRAREMHNEGWQFAKHNGKVYVFMPS
jgi:antirestriction protein